MQYHCDRCSKPTGRPVAVGFELLWGEKPGDANPTGKRWLAGTLLCPGCAAELAEQAGVSREGLDRIWGK